MRKGAGRNLRMLGGGLACSVAAFVAVMAGTQSSFHLPGQVFAGEPSRVQTQIRWTFEREPDRHVVLVEMEAKAPPNEGPVGQCPQPRQTRKAPAEFLQKENPLKPNKENLTAGERLYQETAKPLACVQCHGKDGSGRGLLGTGLVPQPRNFTCGKMMKDLPDGQLFFVIKNGSQGTGMIAFPNLSDEQVWQLILFIRQFAK